MKKGDPRNQMTNIPGLYAAGEADYQYHGANRLGANSLLSCIFAGLFMGPSVKNFIESQKVSAADAPQSLFEAGVKQEEAKAARIAGTRATRIPMSCKRNSARRCPTTARSSASTSA